MEEILINLFGIDEKIINMSKEVENEIEYKFKHINKVKEFNQYKVIGSFINNCISDTHFIGTSGYGYDDKGRDTLEKVYSDIFKTEDSLVRHQIANGTQAIAICLYGNLMPNDELVSITGKPYDTLDSVIGIRGEGFGSLKDYNVIYKQVDLTNEGKIDFLEVFKTISEKTKMVYIQRSRGYSTRPSISIDEIEEIIKEIKKKYPQIIVLIDNCYGEFVEELEPTEVGADMIAGSLIKNPGGGLALSGGYVSGKKELVKRSAYRLTTPGIGKKVGASLGQNRRMYQGLYMAPHVVSESLKGAIFAGALFKKLGFDVSPNIEEKRTDIIQSIKFNNEEQLICFCQGIQASSPIDSYVVPEPWEMPGYDSKVIMAAGCFVQGASIELSADAPIKEPYIAYMQGGLVYENVKLAVLKSCSIMLNKKVLKL